MAEYDDLIAALLEKRRARLAFSEQNAREAAALADAVEIRLGAPEGSIRVIDRNGVSGDEAVLLALDDVAHVEFVLSLTIEYQMEMLTSGHVKVVRMQDAAGNIEYSVGGQPVAATSFTDPHMIDAALAALRQSVLDQKV